MLHWTYFHEVTGVYITILTYSLHRSCWDSQWVTHCHAKSHRYGHGLPWIRAVQHGCNRVRCCLSAATAWKFGSSLTPSSLFTGTAARRLLAPIAKKLCLVEWLLHARGNMCWYPVGYTCAVEVPGICEHMQAWAVLAHANLWPPAPTFHGIAEATNVFSSMQGTLQMVCQICPAHIVLLIIIIHLLLHIFLPKEAR